MATFEIKIQYYTRQKFETEYVVEEKLKERVEELMSDGKVQYIQIWRDRLGTAS